jgi:hypothetical protein
LPSSKVTIPPEAASDQLFNGLIARYNELGQYSGKEFYLWTPQNIEIIGQESGTNISIEYISGGNVTDTYTVNNLGEGKNYHFSGNAGIYHITSNNKVSVYVTTSIDNPNKATFYSFLGKKAFLYTAAYSNDSSSGQGEAIFSSFYDGTQIALSDKGDVDSDDTAFTLQKFDFHLESDNTDLMSGESIGEIWNTSSIYPYNVVVGYSGDKNSAECNPKYEVYSENMKEFVFTAIGSSPYLIITSTDNNTSVTVKDISQGYSNATDISTFQLDKDEIKLLPIPKDKLGQSYPATEIYLISNKPVKVTVDNDISSSNYYSGCLLSAINNRYGIGSKYLFMAGSSNTVTIVSLENDNSISYALNGNIQTSYLLKAGESTTITGLAQTDIVKLESDPTSPKNFLVIAYHSDNGNIDNTSLTIPIPAVPNSLIYDTPIRWKGLCDLTGNGQLLATNCNGFLNITKRQFLAGKSYYFQTGSEDPGHQWLSGKTLKLLTLNAVAEGKPIFKPYVDITLINTHTGTTDVNTSKQFYDLSVIPDPKWSGTLKAGIKASDGYEDTVRFFTLEVKPENTPPLIQPVVNDSGLQWWEKDWHYRIKVTVTNQNVTLNDYIVSKHFNFKTLLNSIGISDFSLGNVCGFVI